MQSASSKAGIAADVSTKRQVKVKTESKMEAQVLKRIIISLSEISALETLETEQNQLKRINQELTDKCRKCCNFVAHIKKRYTVKEKDAIQDNGQRRKKKTKINTQMTNWKIILIKTNTNNLKKKRHHSKT